MEISISKEEGDQRLDDKQEEKVLMKGLDRRKVIITSFEQNLVGGAF